MVQYVLHIQKSVEDQRNGFHLCLARMMLNEGLDWEDLVGLIRRGDEIRKGVKDDY